MHFFTIHLVIQLTSPHITTIQNTIWDRGEERDMSVSSVSTPAVICIQGRLFSKQKSNWKQFSLSFDCVLWRIRKLISINNLPVKFKVLLAHFDKVFCCLNTEEGKQQNVTPVSEKKSCSSPCVPYPVTTSLELHFRTPAAASSRCIKRLVKATF